MWEDLLGWLWQAPADPLCQHCLCRSWPGVVMPSKETTSDQASQDWFNYQGIAAKF